MIKNDLPSERPRERCLQTGPSCLSLRECLAILLGSGPPKLGCMGLANRILERPGKGLAIADQERALFTALESSGSGFLQEIDGLGPAGKARILSAFEIGRRYAAFRTKQTPKREKPSSLPRLAFQALGKVPEANRIDPREWFGFIPFYRTGDLGELCIVENGVRTHVNIDPAEFFARLLALRPQALFLFHNHPAGNMTPSHQDLDLTAKVGKLARQFDIRLLGHWVVAPKNERWIAPLGC